MRTQAIKNTKINENDDIINNASRLVAEVSHMLSLYKNSRTVVRNICIIGSRFDIDNYSQVANDIERAVSNIPSQINQILKSW